ncbi:hypothetical protein OPV22_023303 [Ensete ventricosum]|uniref:RING-type domain-containing protein n=1 Tax=Ensete ventricosum TaxID=4639 RepID=A0AAV8QLV0_ENSVE|nr:hypothetical protein OPV22_023303 [Ensete ventricosum]
MRLEEEAEEEEAEEEKERKNLRRSSGKISIMVFVAPEKLTVLLIILLASLPSNAMAGRQTRIFGKYAAPKGSMTKDLSKHGLHQEQISIVHSRILKPLRNSWKLKCFKEKFSTRTNMGANCCVAVKDKPLPSPAQFDVSTYRNVRRSPTWSFRWDNRTHIEDAMDNVAQFSHHHSGNVGPQIRSDSPTEAESLSDRGSPSDALHLEKWHESPIRSGSAGKLKDVSADDQSIKSDSSCKSKDSLKLSYFASAPDVKFSKSVPSTPSSSSYKADPSSSRYLTAAGYHLFIPLMRTAKYPTSSRRACRSPGFQLCRQISDSRIPSLQSLNENSSPEGRHSFVLSFRSNELSTGGSHGESSDGWSMRTFSELVASSNRERWSFDSDNLTSSSSKITGSNPQQTTQVSPDQPICKVCSKLLMEHCVVAVLVCGHIYHAECLEKMTTEIDRYDPTCPVCTHGEKSAAKLFKKAETKARNKLSRIGVADNNPHGDAICDRHKKGSEGPKMGASSSTTQSSFGRSFLRQRFSIGRPSRSTTENESNRKKGFWERYRKE